MFTALKINATATVFALTLLFLLLSGCKTGNSEVKSKNIPFQRGICYAHIHANGLGYGSDISRQTKIKMKELGIEWLSLTPFGYQKTVSSPDIYFKRDSTLSADNLVEEIRSAHSSGMKVMLKPHIWSTEFWHGGKWHGDIKMENDEDWKIWFGNYRKMILHFAAISASEKVEAFSIGCELAGTMGHKTEWLELIRKIRTVYPGLITYSASQGEFEKVPFWNELDFIGINAYFPVSSQPDTNVQDMLKGWETHLNKLEIFSAKHNKYIVFTEIGYRSVRGASIKPWEWKSKKDVVSYSEQSNAYEAMFLALQKQSWFRGLYIWKSFTAAKIEDEDTDFGYSPIGKSAENIIKKYYTSENWQN